MICNDTGFSKSVVDIAINSLLDNITLAISNGNEVQFAGFGTFKLKQRAARMGRNPRTNEAVHIPPRTVTVFEAGSRLKDAAKNFKG